MSDFNRVNNPSCQSQQRSIGRNKGEYLLFRCLVVSNDSTRQSLLAQSAEKSGWDVAVCSDVEMAIATARRTFVQLALVDLVDDMDADYRELLERLASSGNMLLLVCGNENDMQEELWVRQLGAWLYLPGVDSTTNVSLLCDEARHLVERMHAAANTPRPQSRTGINKRKR